jgi:quercetin dioxygenase-like cupin family protein
MTKPGIIVRLPALSTPVATEQLTTLVKTTQVEILQLLMPQGSSIPAHEAEGELVVHCLTGFIAIEVLDARHELDANQLLYLDKAAHFSITGLADSVVLLTIIAPKQGANVELIGAHDAN